MKIDQEKDAKVKERFSSFESVAGTVGKLGVTVNKQIFYSGVKRRAGTGRVTTDKANDFMANRKRFFCF